MCAVKQVARGGNIDPRSPPGGRGGRAATKRNGVDVHKYSTLVPKFGGSISIFDTVLVLITFFFLFVLIDDPLTFVFEPCILDIMSPSEGLLLPPSKRYNYPEINSKTRESRFAEKEGNCRSERE